jgi:hypothetical protein
MKNLYGMSSLPTNMIADTTPEPSKIFDHAEHIPEPIHEEIDSEAPRRSKRPRTAKSFGDDFTVYLVDDTPKTIAEAFASPDADDWKEVVHSEMDSILSNGTWKLVDRSYGCKSVGCKWVFKKSLGQMIQLISTRQGLWPRVILKRKANISLILIHMLLD